MNPERKALAKIGEQKWLQSKETERIKAEQEWQEAKKRY
jgi:hypothetical protein